MEHSPSWEANRFSASEIPCILRNPKVYYRIHKRPPPVPVLCQLDPVHAATTNFLKTHSGNKIHYFNSDLVKFAYKQLCNSQLSFLELKIPNEMVDYYLEYIRNVYKDLVNNGNGRFDRQY